MAIDSMAAKRAPKIKIDCIELTLRRRVHNKGPIIKPIPNIAQRSQKFLFLSSGVLEISARIAWIILILPPVIPLIIREKR